MEIMNTEVSGPPFKATETHTVGDAKKLLMMSVCPHLNPKKKIKSTPQPRKKKKKFL